MYTTCEHAYHCQRFTDPELIEKIKNARSAFKAWETAQPEKSNQVADWDTKKIEVMEKIIRLKVSQHEDVKKALLESDNLEIVKNQPGDPFWGNGSDGKGQNMMGKLWMKVREEL